VLIEFGLRVRTELLIDKAGKMLDGELAVGTDAVANVGQQEAFAHALTRSQRQLGDVVRAQTQRVARGAQRHVLDLDKPHDSLLTLGQTAECLDDQPVLFIGHHLVDCSDVIASVVQRLAVIGQDHTPSSSHDVDRGVARGHVEVWPEGELLRRTVLQKMQDLGEGLGYRVTGVLVVACHLPRYAVGSKGVSPVQFIETRDLPRPDGGYKLSVARLLVARGAGLSRHG